MVYPVPLLIKTGVNNSDIAPLTVPSAIADKSVFNRKEKT
jgi:hypothetical protein